MARKTVITKVLDVDAQDGIIEFPQNRTLYADQFTDKAPNTDEEREGFKPKNMTTRQASPSKPRKAAPLSKTLNSSRSRTLKTSNSLNKANSSARKKAK